jgi:hypothetical protein
MSAEFSWLAVVCSDLVNELLPDLAVAGDNDCGARHSQSPRAPIDTLIPTMMTRAQIGSPAVSASAGQLSRPLKRRRTI